MSLRETGRMCILEFGQCPFVSVLLWEQEVTGSIPATPTIVKKTT